MDLQEHIDSLAHTLRCKVVQEPNMAGMMYVEYEPSVIEGPTIVKQQDYFVMLHELGHVFHGHTQGRPPYHDKTYYFDHGVLRSEAEAWEYALDVASVEPTPDTRRFMWHACLGTYYSSSKVHGTTPTRLGNGNRHYVEFVFDIPDEYFFDIKRRLLNS